jgi:hypothetical protein
MSLARSAERWALPALAVVLALAAACRQDTPSRAERALSSERPRLTDRPRPAPDQAQPFDQARVLESLAQEARQRGRVRVLVKFDVEGGLEVGPLSASSKKELSVQIRGQQQSVLAAIGRDEDDRDVRLVAGLPFLAFDASEAEIQSLQQRLDAEGSLSVLADGRATRLRVERAEFLSAQTATPRAAEPLAKILTRLEADLSPATGQGRIVAVIDTAVQPDALPLAGRLEPLPTSIGVAATTTQSVDTTPTHGTLVASVVAAAAPGCRVLAFGLADKGGDVAPDAVADALQRIYLADSDYLAQIAAVCVSLASKSLQVTGECAFDPALPALGTMFQIAVWNLTASGVSVVVSAGNAKGAYCTQVFEPWCMPEALCIGSSDGVDLQRSQFSPWSALVDACAPGGGIALQIRPTRGPDSLSGTSISAPIVAAMLARLAEAHPDQSRAVREAALLRTGEFVEDCAIKQPEPRLAAAIRSLTSQAPPGPIPGGQ